MEKFLFPLIVYNLMLSFIGLFLSKQKLYMIVEHLFYPNNKTKSYTILRLLFFTLPKYLSIILLIFEYSSGIIPIISIFFIVFNSLLTIELKNTYQNVINEISNINIFWESLLNSKLSKFEYPYSWKAFYLNITRALIDSLFFGTLITLL